VRERVTLGTAKANDIQQTADKLSDVVKVTDVEKQNDVEVTDSAPAPLPRSTSLQILLPGDISPHGTTPTADPTASALGPSGAPSPQGEPYSLIKEIFGATSRL
jgi:hypothetical protein